MKKLIKFMLLLIVIFIVGAFSINFYMIKTSKINIVNNISNIPNDIDCILILGASIKEDKPSKMLEDRLLKGIELYKKNISNKIIVSGDHREDDYDEVNVMKNYLIEKGIPSEKIFMDHYGISSYDSIYRAKKNYKANKIVIVTQKYHLYRSIYIAKKFDIEVYGVLAKGITYPGQDRRDIREFFARIKDFFKVIFKPEPDFLGEVYSIKGNGDKTNNK